MAFDLPTMQAMQSLFTGEQADSDSEDDLPHSRPKNVTPGDVGPTKKSNDNVKVAAEKPKSKDIWESEEVPEGAEYEDIYDPRPQPDYDITYKQAVCTEDIFLGMSNKTNATSSCEDMVIKIKLPNTKMADVDLDVKEKFLNCRTAKYKLGLHLPHPCDPKQGKAQFDTGKETLIVTLRMNRFYDYVNF